MKHKKTFYLSKQAEEKLKEITKIENRSQSNAIEYILKKYTPKPW
jgi:hypothetical protein